MISDIPAFDVGLGYELYALLLKPVEAGWKSAKSLIVGHQWRAWPVAAVAAADRARRSRATGDRLLPAIARCRGSRARTP